MTHESKGETILDALRSGVPGPTLSDALLDVLANETSRKILCSAIESGKTVEQIRIEQQVPLSTCYKRVGEFVGKGLMIVERKIITGEGKKYSVYRTTLSSIDIRLKNGRVSVEISMNPAAADRLNMRRMTYPREEIRGAIISA